MDKCHISLDLARSLVFQTIVELIDLLCFAQVREGFLNLAGLFLPSTQLSSNPRQEVRAIELLKRFEYTLSFDLELDRLLQVLLLRVQLGQLEEGIPYWL